jgi:hypothetical protein
MTVAPSEGDGERERENERWKWTEMEMKQIQRNVDLTDLLLLGLSKHFELFL